jgi:hypothetical protein
MDVREIPGDQGIFPKDPFGSVCTFFLNEIDKALDLLSSKKED